MFNRIPQRWLMAAVTVAAGVRVRHGRRGST